MSLNRQRAHLDCIEPYFTVHVIYKSNEGRNALTVQGCVLAFCGDGDAGVDKQSKREIKVLISGP